MHHVASGGFRRSERSFFIALKLVDSNYDLIFFLIEAEKNLKASDNKDFSLVSKDDAFYDVIKVVLKSFIVQ